MRTRLVKCHKVNAWLAQRELSGPVPPAWPLPLGCVAQGRFPLGVAPVVRWWLMAPPCRRGKTVPQTWKANGLKAGPYFSLRQGRMWFAAPGRGGAADTVQFGERHPQLWRVHTGGVRCRAPGRLQQGPSSRSSAPGSPCPRLR